MNYFAKEPTDKLVPILQAKITAFDKHLQSTGLMTIIRNSYDSFYGNSAISDGGEQGELKSMRINHYASLVRNLVSLVTNNKPAWQPIASNTDSKSQAAAILATGLLDFYMKDRRLDRMFKDACQMSCFLLESWVGVTWDTQRGELIDVDPDTGVALHEGDLDYAFHQLNNIIRDQSKKGGEFEWLVTREYKNKYNLAAQFPEFESDITQLSDKDSLGQITFQNNYIKTDSDQIPFYTFYHKPTAAMPEGRLTTFTDARFSLTDGPLPYPKIPLVRISAETRFESAFAHSPMLDCLPLQIGMDAMASTLLSNNSAFGVQNLWIKKGSGMNVSQLQTGLNLIESNDKPEPLQLTASSPETYKFVDMLVQHSQLLSGVNDAIRGQSAAGTSGAALALLSQQAIQYSNGLAQSYVGLIEDVGTLSIEILQKYANTKRVAVLTGKHNKPLLKEWSSSDLEGVSRITIESGNALSKTASGRLTMADSLLQSGMIKRPEQYLAVLTTGQLEPLYENELSQLTLIRDENEMLSEGKTVRAILTDDHQNHILEHASVLSSPSVRQDPESPVIQNTLNHIQEHLDLAQNMPPNLAMLLKQPPLQPPMPQGPPPQGAIEEIPPVMDGENSISTEAGQVNGPSMPTNPATGEQIPVNQ